VSVDPLATAAWTDVLDRLEADVRAVDRALARGDILPIETWLPPRDLGPLPERLRRRAEGLARRLGHLQTRSRERLRGLAGELDDLERRRKAGVAYGGDPTARTRR
jgi:hypothetical protein